MKECDVPVLNNMDVQELNKGMIPQITDSPITLAPGETGQEYKVGSAKFHPWSTLVLKLLITPTIDYFRKLLKLPLV